MTIQSKSMRRLSVAQAKAQLSALLDAVEQGEAVEITRRGVSVARLVQAPQQASQAFDLAAFCAATNRQPLHSTAAAADVVRDLRDAARF